MTSIDEVKNDSNYIPVLDKGFVGFVDKMGDDSSIVQAARVSYGSGTKSVRGDRGLIRYLLRHKHTTPFEMVEFKFHCKMPIFVARQWVRHRTANINEYSGRYSIMSDEFYFPAVEDVKPQSLDNKQGRNGEMSADYVEDVLDKLEAHYEASYEIYTDLVEEDGDYPGIARELGRIVLPVSNYTEWYWKCDLHNIMHFLKLRMDPHAQKEVRVYAEAMYDIVKQHCPVAMEAFEDYVLNAVELSAMERKLVEKTINTLLLENWSSTDDFLEQFNLTSREWEEFKAKFNVNNL